MILIQSRNCLLPKRSGFGVQPGGGGESPQRRQPVAGFRLGRICQAEVKGTVLSLEGHTCVTRQCGAGRMQTEMNRRDRCWLLRPVWSLVACGNA